VRVAFVGKGGSGKSAISGTLVRILAAEGKKVLAIDSDPMPGLAFSIGVDLTDVGIPDDAVEENPDEGGPRYRLKPGITSAEAIEKYAAYGPDGIRFLQFGKLRGPSSELFRSQMAFHQILRELKPNGWSVVGDLPGGTRQPFFGWGRYARMLIVVAEPTAKSLLSARRLARLELMKEAPRVVAVANKVREPADIELVAAHTDLEVIGAVPEDQAVVDADRRGRPLIDEAPDCPAVAAVRSLARTLQQEAGQ